MLTLLALGAVATVARPARADCVDGRPLNVGHRGTGPSEAGAPYAENTIPSLVAAGDEGATMVEIDVQLSADMVPVLMHDATVDVTTDGMGCVTELTLAELQMLDAGAGTAMEGMGVTVPTLEEVLAAVDLDLNVEIKNGGEGCAMFTDQEVATAILDVLANDPGERLQTVSSFEWGILDEVRALDPDIYIGAISVTSANAGVASDSGFDALNLIEGSVDETAVTSVHDLGLELNTWTVNDPARLTELFDLDVDAIITDDPPAVEAERAARCGGGDETSGGTEGDGSTGASETTGAPGGTGVGESTGGDPGDSTGSMAGGEDDGGEGCGCRTSASARDRRGWAGLLGLGLVLVRMRRRRR